MPSRERVDAFIALVVSNDHVRAIEEFYHEDASMQENGQPPREGRDVLVEHERKALARVKSVHTHPPKAVLIDGDRVAIHWRFDFTDLSGALREWEEVALQEWRGDRILRERFFYNPAEFATKPGG